MIDGFRDMVVWVCLLGGGAFSLIGGIGLIRMPDFYTRSHAASLTDTMGAFLILLGLMLHSGANLVTVKLLFIFAFHKAVQGNPITLPRLTQQMA